MKVTGKQVMAFWKYMAKKYDFDIVTKADAKEMRIVGWALEQMHIQKKADFLKKYTTTIVLGKWRCVYIPFEIGEGTQAKLIYQNETCVHESQHVVQATRDRMQPMKYLRSDASRAFYEADAYRANMEMHRFFTGRMLSAKYLANLLKGYSIGKADRRICEKHLIIASKVVKRGGVITGPSKVAIRWWKKQQPAKARVRKVMMIRV